MNKRSEIKILSKDEIYRLYLKGEPIDNIASMLMSGSNIFTPKGAKNHVRRVIIDYGKIKNI